MSGSDTRTIFESLPGLEVPVGKVVQSLDEIWAGAPNGGESAPSEFRASQMNLVLHLGMRTTHEAAATQFEIALALSRRHPARTVVLCPIQQGEPGSSMRAKIFSECYIGASGKEMICCEVVMLSYPFDTRCYLENQVSVCLEADLPVYYWPHCIASAARLEDYSHLLKGSRRIILDTGCETEGVEEALAPLAGKLRDLADTRLLQVRQSLGRYLSSFAPATLVDGLRTVTVGHKPALAAEARRLLDWARRSLDQCGGPPPAEAVFSIRSDESKGPAGLSLDMDYATTAHTIRWEADFDAGHARMSANMGAGDIAAEGPVSLLKPEVALAEAIFS